MTRLDRLALILILLAVAGAAALGVLVSLLGIADPAGAKLADDNDPFGPPPSRWSMGITARVCVTVSVTSLLAAVHLGRSHEE